MAGYKELLAIDWDDHAIKTFQLNFPNVPAWKRDIRELKGQEILDFCGIKKGELDVLDGSPPCQGFSTAGKRRVTDPRNDLILHNIRLIGEIQPKIFLMENVSGMVKGQMKGLFKEYMKAMKDLEYNVRCKLMNAKYYNVPQSRQRLIWIGLRNDLNKKPIFPKPNRKIITTREILKDYEEKEKKNRPKVTDGLIEYAKKLRCGESASHYHKKGSLFGLIRLHPDKPSPTIIKSAGTGLIHYLSTDYFCSIMELQRLQSFPESFKFIGKRSMGIDRIGNSVPPLFMKAIAETLRKEILE